MTCGGVAGCMFASTRVMMALKDVPSLSSTPRPPIRSNEVALIINHEHWRQYRVPHESNISATSQNHKITSYVAKNMQGRSVYIDS
jgi:hypothetical protein